MGAQGQKIDLCAAAQHAPIIDSTSEGEMIAAVVLLPKNESTIHWAVFVLQSQATFVSGF